ncbi:tetratricopeptide repeat protein [Kitasatospora sp. McL0602]|uniref:tetratricopeptide repeat protein n=1 Tax=Kitasatospora sp. McL0602 TaxID=3439530 RepID=UPI003F8C8DA8
MGAPAIGTIERALRLATPDQWFELARAIAELIDNQAELRGLWDYERAEPAVPERLGELAAALARHPQLSRRIRKWIDETPEEPGTPYRNTISGAPQFNGATVQARDIRGGVHLHSPPPRLPVPRQLLPPPAHFAGRAAELAALDRSSRNADSGGGLLVVVSGPAGVGKTALASHWLRRLAPDYPDGQLYVDLRGYAPGGPADPAEALGELLRAFGVSPVPAGTAEGSALWRSLTAGQSLVVMLDNALTAAQVRPLLPGSQQSVVVVTSRRWLTGLGIDGAVFHQLGCLGADESTEILRGRLGAERVAAEPEAAREVVELCDGLPLAVCVAAARIAARPRQLLAVTAQALGREADRLSVLRLEGDNAVQGALDASYRCLPPEAARLYRLLGHLPVATFGRSVAAAALGEAPTAAELLLEVLAEVNLLEELGLDRYRFHDLVRLHARTLDTAAAHEAAVAVRRVAEWFLQATTKAEELITPTHRSLARDYTPGPPLPPVPFAEPGAALRWLDEQQSELMAVLRAVAGHGWDGTAWQLADAMWPLFHRLRPYPIWIEGTEIGLAAARRSGDLAALGRMLTDSGGGLRNAQRPEEAVPRFVEALELARRCGGAREEAQALHGLGQSHHRAGRPAEAAEYYTAALTLRREIGYARGAALSVLALGEVRLDTGDLEQAVGLLAQARTELLALPDRYEAARAAALAGRAQGRLGRPEPAAGLLAEAVAEFRACGSRHWEAYALEMVGELAESRGDFEEALRWFGESLGIYRSVRAPDAARLADRIAGLPGAADHDILDT